MFSSLNRNSARAFASSVLPTQELRQGLRQLGLADAGRAHEQERADGPLLVRKARAVAADGVGHGLNGPILTDYPLVQLGLHAQQLLLLALEHPLHGNTRPLRHDLGDVLRSNRLGNNRFLDGGSLRGEVVDGLLRRDHLAVAELRDLAVVARTLGRGRLDLVVLHLLAGRLQPGEDVLLLVPALHQLVALRIQLLQLGFQFLHLQGHALALDGLLLDLLLADGAVQVVDGLRHGVHLQLIAFLQATQDRDGFRGRGLIDHHHLEPALQGLVGLEVLLVFVQGGGADGAELAPRQGRLQDVGRVHRAGGTSRAHEGMDLVDEQDDFTGGVHDLLDDAFQTLFELTLIFRARDKGAHVQGIDLLGLQVLRHVAGDDVLGDTLRNGGLAHARFTHQDRVVLGPPGEDLEHPPDFVVPADDRVELPGGSPLVEVHCEPGKKSVLVVICHNRYLLFVRWVRSDSRPPIGQTAIHQMIFLSGDY